MPRNSTVSRPTAALLESPKRNRYECGNRTRGLPRAQQSRRARRDGCIAPAMRKPDRTKLPAVAALLLSSYLRLLVCHGLSSLAALGGTTASPG